MSNLSDEQRRNLEKDGYTIIERGSKTHVIKEYEDGKVEYVIEDGKVHKLNNYYGDVRDRDNHDHLAIKYGEEYGDDDGKMSGHGFGHKDWF